MRTPRRALATAVALAMLVVTACGDDDTTAAVSGDPAEPTTETTAAEEAEEAVGTELTVTLTDEEMELSETEIPGGVVEVTLDNQASGFASADLARVQPGTTPEQFAPAFAPVLDGGPIPAFVLGYASVGTDAGQDRTASVLLEPGEYIVWSMPEPPEEEPAEGEDEGAPEGDVEPEVPVAEDPATAEGEAPAGGNGGGEGGDQATTAEDLMMATLTVTAAEGETELPETDNAITATDNAFEVDVAGPGSYTFRNEGPNEFHHAVLIDFGTNPVDAVRSGFKALLESDGQDVPEGIDPEQIDFGSAGDSGVFSPGGAGVFDAFFEDGNTYAVACFISDRAGGPPHATAYDMFEVFQVGG